MLWKALYKSPIIILLLLSLLSDHPFIFNHTSSCQIIIHVLSHIPPVKSSIHVSSLAHKIPKHIQYRCTQGNTCQPFTRMCIPNTGFKNHCLNRECSNHNLLSQDNAPFIFDVICLSLLTSKPRPSILKHIFYFFKRSFSVFTFLFLLLNMA